MIKYNFLAVVFGLFVFACSNNKESINTGNENLGENKKEQIPNSISSISIIQANHKVVNSPIYLTSPKWSPDGKYILATGEEMKGLHIINVETLEIEKSFYIDESVGYLASWMNDSKTIMFRTKTPDYRFLVKTINIDNNKEVVIKDVNPNTLREESKAKNGDILVYTNVDLESPEIFATKKGTNETWQVTDGTGQFYEAILSPDQTKVALHQGNLMLVYSIEGKQKISEVGMGGVITAWTPDNQWLIYYKDESPDGHQITNAEIFAVNVKGDKTIQLTNTIGITEMFPSISSDGKFISYSDDKSGKIMIDEISFE